MSLQLYIDIFNANKSSFYREIKAIRIEELTEDVIKGKLSLQQLRQARDIALKGFHMVYSDIDELAIQYTLGESTLTEIDRKGIYNGIAMVTAVEEVIADFTNILKIKQSLRPNHLKLVVNNSGHFDSLERINHNNKLRILKEREEDNSSVIKYDL